MRTLIALALLLAACTPDLTGLEEASRYSHQLVGALRVGQVLCDAPEVLVGESIQCAAYSPQGTRLSVEGVAPVVWYANSAATLEVDLAGRATGVAPGATRVYAEGARGSVAWYEVTVIE